MGTLWDASLYELVETQTCNHWIFTRLLQKAIGIQVCLFILYVLFLLLEKKNCWTRLREVSSSIIIDNIILTGDLNVILNQSEKKGEVLLSVAPSKNKLMSLFYTWSW